MWNKSGVGNAMELACRPKKRHSNQKVWREFSYTLVVPAVNVRFSLDIRFDLQITGVSGGKMNFENFCLSLYIVYCPVFQDALFRAVFV